MTNLQPKEEFNDFLNFNFSKYELNRKEYKPHFIEYIGMTLSVLLFIFVLYFFSNYITTFINDFSFSDFIFNKLTRRY